MAEFPKLNWRELQSIHKQFIHPLRLLGPLTAKHVWYAQNFATLIYTLLQYLPSDNPWAAASTNLSVLPLTPASKTPNPKLISPLVYFRYPLFILVSLFWYSVSQPWLPTWQFAAYSLFAAWMLWYMGLSPPVLVLGTLAGGIRRIPRDIVVPLFGLTMIWAEGLVYILAAKYKRAGLGI